MTAAEASATRDADVLVVGAGLNGLVCALVLARAGLQVLVLDDKPVVGGAHRTEYPFARAPRLATSTGLHRLAIVPRDLLRELGVELPVARRQPALFAPTTQPGRYLLAAAGTGSSGPRSAAGGVVGDRDRDALEALERELDAIAEDLSPAWTDPVASLEEIADRHVRAELRTAFLQLCRGTLAEYAARFGVQSGLLKGLLAADAVSGSFVSWDSPGSGATLLVRHVAAVADFAVGGASAIVRTLAEAAQAAGVAFALGNAVTQIAIEGNIATGVVLADGRVLRAAAVITSADPWRLRAMVGADRLPAEYTRRLESFMRPGGIAKLNLALAELPRFACLPEDAGQHRAAVFLLPNAEEDAVRTLGRAFGDANAGRLPVEPAIECVFPSVTDPAHTDPDGGRHSASLLVPWVPYDLAGTTWSAEEERFTMLLVGILDSFAPGARDLVVETSLLHPKKIETHFGLTRGHVFHVDDNHLFGDRMPPHTPISGLYACGRGCAPAGRFGGAAGLVAARRVLSDFELANERTEVGANR